MSISLEQNVTMIVQFVLMDYVIIVVNVKILMEIAKIMQHMVQIVKSLVQILMEIARNVIEIELVFFVGIKLFMVMNAKHHVIVLIKNVKLMELVKIPQMIALMKYFLGQNVINFVMRLEIIV